ncbi:MAG: phosphatidate cytidylyltransferase [Acidimicrobiales bacterium]
MDERPRNPDGDDDEMWDDPDVGDDDVESRRPIRARDFLRDNADPAQFGALPIIDPDQPPPGGHIDDEAGEQVVSLPHWTDPPTGEVPQIFASGDDDLDPWSTVSGSQPRWSDQSGGWNEADLDALGEDLPPVAGRGERTEDEIADDFFTFDSTEPEPEVYTVPRDPAEPYGGAGADPYATGRAEGPGAAGRNMGAAAVVGVGLAAVALVSLSVGAWLTMGLVVAVLVLASAEVLSTLRRVGYTPPALVGLTAAAAMPLATYWRGESGLVLAIVLTLVVSLAWYLLGVAGDHAVPNIGVTLLTIVYVGVLGSFAALLLRSPHGVGLLLAAVLGPIAYDIAGLFIGRSMGRSPLSAVSPNKTMEGTVGGMLAALLVTVVVVGGLVGGGITPFNTVGNAFVLGLVLACVSPIGDLFESMIKRDLGVKDMGTILPGHGGVLDRFDAILFALPATYYVALVVL